MWGLLPVPGGIIGPEPVLDRRERCKPQCEVG